MTPQIGEKKLSTSRFVYLEYFYFSNSVGIPYLLLNVRIPFKASVKKKL